MNEFDVVVIGGGPAGCAAAISCAQAGRSVALLEHRHFPRHKVCGDVINPGCWPILERLGASPSLRSIPSEAVDGAAIVPSAGGELRIAAKLTAIRRSVFDACLLACARAAGVRVFEGEAAHAVRPGWTILTARDSYRGQVLVGADGRQSLVARQTGLARRERLVSVAARFVALQGHYPAPADLARQVYLHTFPGGYSGLVRVDGELANLCIVTGPALAGLARDPAALFARTVWQNPRFRALGIRPEPVEPLQGAYPLRRRPSRPCGDGVWLAGDALRVVEPFSGQGIYFALQTGEWAARAIVDRKVDYGRWVRRLYHERARTNRLVRGLMYRDGAARRVVAVLRHWPRAVNWLAANVLNNPQGIEQHPGLSFRIPPRGMKSL